MTYLIIGILVFFSCLVIGARNRSKWNLYGDSSRYQFIFVCIIISIFWMFTIPAFMVGGFIHLLTTLVKRIEC